MAKTETKRGRKTPCVSYVRVSGDGQITGDGPERQRVANESYAKAMASELILRHLTWACPVCVTWRTGTNFPALGLCEQHKIKVCLVENASRVSRKLMVGEIILEEFKKHGCKVIESTSGVELTADDEDETRPWSGKCFHVSLNFRRKLM